MATSNIRIAGATYPDVPSVTLKDTSNNDVSFVLTSDATASADKIEQGYTAYVNGQKIVGTSSGGGGTDTSQANATNSAIMEGAYAYVNGERIEGLGGNNYYTFSKNDGFPSSSVLKTYSLSDVEGGSSQTYFDADGAMTLSGNRYSYDITGWTSSLQSGTKYSLGFGIYDSAEYDGEYSNWSYFFGGTTLPIKLTATKTVYGETTTYEHITVYLTETTMYTDDMSSHSGVSMHFSIEDRGYSGFFSVNVKPYTLVEKTVTPLTQTQIVRSSSKIASVTDYLPMDATTLQAYGFTISSSRTSYNFPSNLILTEGATYRINARYHRYADGKDYVFNALLKVGSIMTMVLSLTNPTTTTEVKLSLFQRYLELSTLSDSIANRQLSSFYLDISTENIEADALGQVTVNPIPSEYVIPTGTISITQNGTTDVSAYQYANVNVSASTTLQSKTATPTTSSQTITADTGYDGLSQVTVNPIPNNFVDTTDSTASATDIVSGATAYVNGSKITGTLVVQSYYEGSGEPSSSLGNNGDIYFDIS